MKTGKMIPYPTVLCRITHVATNYRALPGIREWPYVVRIGHVRLSFRRLYALHVRKTTIDFEMGT